MSSLFQKASRILLAMAALQVRAEDRVIPIERMEALIGASARALCHAFPGVPGGAALRTGIPSEPVLVEVRRSLPAFIRATRPELAEGLPGCRFQVVSIKVAGDTWVLVKAMPGTPGRSWRVCYSVGGGSFSQLTVDRATESFARPGQAPAR